MLVHRDPAGVLVIMEEYGEIVEVKSTSQLSRIEILMKLQILVASKKVTPVSDFLQFQRK